MAINEVARAEVILNGQKANATLKELENAAKQLNAELRKLPTNSAEFVKKTEEFQAVKKRLSEIKQEIVGTESAMSKFADWTNKYFQAITMVAAAGTGFGLVLKGMIDNASALSDSLANIQKTTGMTAEEVSRLNSEFKKFDTRTSREELRQMANVAGQLGIEKNSILPFVEAIDKLNVALGDEIQGGAEEVATSMGTLRNVLTDMKSDNVAEDLLRIGNAINDLSAAGFATAPVMADFANRIGGVGINLGLSSGQVIGLSATMQELAIHVERGGTAVVKILSKMTTNTDEFAKVAGMPLKEFTELVDSNLYGAFVKVLEGSKRAGEGATILGKMIKEMEISGIGAAEVFSKLGSNTELLAEKVALSGNSLLSTSGILEEFEIKNTTLGASLDKLGKDFNSLMSSRAVIDMLTSMMMSVIGLVAWLKVLPKTIKDNAVALTVLTGATLVYIAGITRSMQITVLNNLLMKEGILLRAKDAIVLEYLIVKERLFAFAKTEGTIATKIATIAQWAWNAALTANPIGLVIAGITALVSAVMIYDRTSKAAVALENSKVNLTMALTYANTALKESYEKISAQMHILNISSAAEKKDLQDKIDLTIKQTEADILYLETKQKRIGAESAKPTGWQTFLAMTEPLPANMNKAKDYYSWKNSKDAMGEFDEGIYALKATLQQLKDEKFAINDIINAETKGDKIYGNLLPMLEQKLKYYQTARNNVAAGSEEFLRIQEKIKKVQQEISKYDKSDYSSPEDAKKSKIEALKSSYEKLGEEIKKYIELLKDQVVSDPKQAVITANKIKSLQAEKQKIDDLVGSLVDLKNAKEKTDYEKLNEEIKKYTELLQDQIINDPAQATVTADKIKRLEQEKQKIDDLVKSMTQLKELDIDELLYKMSDGALGGRDETPTEEFDRVTGGLIGPMNGSDEEDPETKLARENYEKEKWLKKANLVLDYASFAADTLSSLNDTITSNENLQLEKDEATNLKKQQNLKNRLNAGLITQKQYDAAVVKMEGELSAKRRKMEHDQAIRNKAIAVVQAGINVAQGITSALAGVPPASYVMAVLTGVLGAIQIAAILGAEVPQAEKGRYNVTGRDDHKSYKNVPWAGAATTGLYSTPTLISEAGPEYVIDAKTTRNLQLNYPGVIDAINFARVPQFAAGNYPKTAQDGTSAQASQSVFENGLLMALNEFNAHARQGIRTFVVYDDVRDSASTMNEIENNVKIG
jgi:TP901 family phage tail tape measure protein